MAEKAPLREVRVVGRVLAVNERMAEENRRRFAARGIFVVNVMSSPGSGKTSLLQKTLQALAARVSAAVIVGDVATTHDAERLAVTGVPVVQVNTDAFGGDCHLAAHVIEKAAEDLDLGAVELLFVENVGNLVCPAEFDIGEDVRVVVLSVTEGEDKPVKYPAMFRTCHAAILNKIDLLPHLDYDKARALAFIHQVHPGMPVFETSARTGEGLEAWIGWLLEGLGRKRASGPR